RLFKCAASRDRVLFASQLKAFRSAPSWSTEIDAHALVEYLRLGYIGQPRTIYRQAAKLPPGHILTLRAGEEPRLECFWNARDIARAGLANQHAAADEEAAERLDALLRDAVRLRMIADVPLAAFLSGGIHSSTLGALLSGRPQPPTVVALMPAPSSRPVKPFSIGFRESGYDEAPHAARVAAHLGTEHTELYVDPDHAIDVIPRIPDWFDEPFADS